MKNKIWTLIIGGLLILPSLVFAGTRERTTAEIKDEIMDLGYANIQEFQKAWGVKVDGVIGPKTAGKLGKAKKHYKKDLEKKAKQERKNAKRQEKIKKKAKTKEVKLGKKPEPAKKIKLPQEIISLTKEEKEVMDELSEEDRNLLALSEDEQITLAIKNSSQVYRLGTERSISLRKIWTPSLSAEYGHEIIDRDRLDNFRRGQEEATYWVKYDFMDIFDNAKRARSYNVERGTFKHKIRCDIRELRGKIRLTDQKVKKCRNDYAQVQQNYKILKGQFPKQSIDYQRLAIQQSQDSQRLYLSLKNVEQELLGYQYTLLALVRGHGRVGYIK